MDKVSKISESILAKDQALIERNAGLREVLNRIFDTIRDSSLAKHLSDKIKKYVTTKNPSDDLTPQEANMIYRDVDFGEKLPLSNKRDLDISWTGHSEYRSDLRDIDPETINHSIQHRLHDLVVTENRHDKKTVKFQDPSIGTMVVDYDLRSKPALADIVTVYASENRLVSRVATKIVAMDFPNQKELDKYLKEHPEADRKNHRVVENKNNKPAQEDQVALKAPAIPVQESTKQAPKVEDSKSESNKTHEVSPHKPKKVEILIPHEGRGSDAELHEIGEKSMEVAKRNAVSGKVGTYKKTGNPFYDPIGDLAGHHSIKNHIGSDGRITPKRKELHKSILSRFLYNGEKPEGQPTFTMLGGGPASGKSSCVKYGLIKLPERHVLVDSDLIKRKLPEYLHEIAVGSHDAARVSHEESSIVASRLQKTALGLGYDTVLDGTGDSNVEKLKSKIDHARSMGHKVVGMYVTCPTEMAIESANNRAAKEGENKGRVLSAGMIKAIHASVSQIFPKVAPLFDECSLFDTTVRGEGIAPKLIAKCKLGGEIEVVDQKLWEDFLKKGEEAK